MQKNNPLVSIVVPNYNTLNDVDNYIKNFLKIDYSPLEIIIVDDHSSDGSYEKLLEYAKKNNNLKIIRNEKNFGPSKTRNNGINFSKGKYIAFLESDMEVDSNYLNILVNELEKDKNLGAALSLVLDLNQKEIIQSDSLHYNPYNFFVYSENFGLKKSNLKSPLKEKYSSIGAVGSIVRKSVLDLVGGFDEKIVHNIDDIDLGWRIWISGYFIKSFSNAVTYHVSSKKFEIREKVTPKVTSELHFHKTPRVFLKNYELKNILKYGFWLYITFFVRILFNLLKGNLAPLKGFLLSIKWLVLNFRDTLEERKKVQSFRNLSDIEIFDKIFMNGSYMQNLRNIRKIMLRSYETFK
jgi:GT2 family glycosyltransferase